jgi:hypothetical protein
MFATNIKEAVVPEIVVFMVSFCVVLLLVRVLHATDSEQGYPTVAGPPTASVKMDLTFKSKSLSLRLRLAVEVFLERLVGWIDRLLK